MPAKQPADTLDLSGAVVVTAGAQAHPVERQASLMLRWEVRRRTGLAWEESQLAPAEAPLIIVGSRERMPTLPPGILPPDPPRKNGTLAREGFTLSVDTAARPAPTVVALGNDRRGTLFAAGRLLRMLEWSEGRCRLPAFAPISTAPAYPIRGVQLGYRRLNDTLDAWEVSDYAQQVRDLICFGNNAVELIPPYSPGSLGMAEHDPLMTMSQWDLTLTLCALLDAYDQEVWFWLTLPEGTAEDPVRRRAALAEREALFAACRRIDHVFVPGGDPGGTHPAVLLPYLAELTEALRRHHPQARMWVSPQKFRGEWLETFYRILRVEQPDWLEGVVWGPGCIDPLPKTRERLAARYPIRHYPDITHAKVCQFPFPYWDEAWAQAYNRQPIQPRPTQYAHICNLHAPYTVGAVSYSDGTGDDVNKVIFDARLWDPQAPVRDILRDYGRLFVSPRFADQVAEGLLLLERNWAAPATDPGVQQTLAHWRAMERRANSQEMSSWRFQQGLMRAYGDAYVQRRVQRENALLQQAYAELARAGQVGSRAALSAAGRILRKGENPRAAAPTLRRRLDELAEMLFVSIGMQLSLDRYGASARDRGAQLDNNDGPLTDLPWLAARLPEIAALPQEGARLEEIDRLVHWTDPGPGGCYDDLGNRAQGKDPHLVRDITWEQDPGFLVSVQDAHYGPGFPERHRLSWAHQAQAYVGPVRLRYQGLDPAARYLFRATYAGRGRHSSLQLYLGGQAVGEPVTFDGLNPVVREFAVPPGAVTPEGTLEVAWESTIQDDVQVAEAWLVRL